MTIRRTLLATTAMLLAAATATADASSHHAYVSLSGGANVIKDQTGRATGPTGDFFGVNATSDTGFAISAAVGCEPDGFLHGLRIELEASYRHNNGGGFWDTTSHDGDLQLRQVGDLVSLEESTYAVLANAWYEFELGKFHPYLGGGAGWAKSDLEGDFAGVVRNPGLAHFDASGDGLAWQLGAGINFDISPSMTIGVGYRYLDAPDVDVPPRAFDNNAGMAPIDVTHQSVMLDLSFKL